MLNKTIPYLLLTIFIVVVIVVFSLSAFIGVFFVIHWYGALTFQSFYCHRYSAHGAVIMSKRVEKLFFILSWLFQGSSFLNPRAYGIMHRLHHEFSDTEGDPHSPHFFKDIFGMMWHTKKIYVEICDNPEKYAQWDTNRPIWPWFERMAESWYSRLGWGVLYLLFYIHFVPASHEWMYIFIPIHWLMNPFHGALVNWGGHKYGYRNIDTNDKSRNCLPWDIMLLGEWFQNNHHGNGGNPNLANKKWEIDPLYWLIKVGSLIGLYKIA